MRLKPPGKAKGCAKTGGRKAGTPNRATLLKQEALYGALASVGLSKAQLAELTPLQAMLACMHKAFAAGDYVAVMIAATAAAPYVHPRLASTEVKVSGSLSTKSDAELTAEIEELERKAAAVQSVH